MDGDKLACSRRSSILKSGKTRNADDDERTDEIITQRRVSFASKFAVKPFTHDAEANTIWDSTYEEAAAHSDQSTCHSTADSAVQLCIDVSSMRQPQHVKTSPLGNDALINTTLVNMDEDIEIDSDDIPFAPVCQTIKDKTKFGMKLNMKNINSTTENCVFLTPSLLENIKDENMLLETSPTLGGNNSKSLPYHMDMVSNNINNNSLNDNFPGSNMNFTIHQTKENRTKKSDPPIKSKENDMEITTFIPTITLQDNLEDKQNAATNINAMDVKTPLQNSGEDGDMEFTAFITTKLLQEKLWARTDVESINNGEGIISDADMEFTSFIPATLLQQNVKSDNFENHDMELEDPLKNNGGVGEMNFTRFKSTFLQDEIKTPLKNNDVDDDMEFTTKISRELLEKLNRKNSDLENPNKQIIEDGDMQFTTVIPTNVLKNLTVNKNTAEVDSCDTKLKFNNFAKNDCDGMNLEESRRGEINKIDSPQIVINNFVKEQDIVLGRRDSLFSQLDGTLYTNPTSDVDDTQYLIHYKLRSSERSASPFQIYEDDNILQDMCELPVLKNMVQHVPQIFIEEGSIEPSNNTRHDLNSPGKKIIPDNDKTNTPLKIYETQNDQSPVPANINQPDILATCTNLHFSASQVLYKSRHSEINVFKPSSKNNTEYSFYESMEMGSTYIAASDESNKHNEEMSLKINCHDIDKIIFTAEVATSLETAEVPVKAVGVLRRSSRGIAEEHVVSSYMPFQTDVDLPNEDCLTTICQESKAISNDSLNAIPLNQHLENLHEYKVVLYDSNDESTPIDHVEEQIETGESDKLICFSDLPCIPPDCSLEQLFDLLGWPAEGRLNLKVIPPRISAEETEKQRVALEKKQQEEDRLFDLFALSCRHMVEAAAQIDQESAAEAEEEVAWMQERIVKPQTVDEWLRQQRKIRSTLWCLKSLKGNKCVIFSKSVQFHIEMNSDPWIITNIVAQIDNNKSLSKLNHFIAKLILDKTQISQIYSAIGSRYNLRTFLEYLQMKGEDIVKMEREFFNVFSKLLVEARVYFDDDFTLQYLLIGRSRWLISINCHDANNLCETSITNITTIWGDIEVPAQQIKNIAKKCPRGVQFLSNFVDAVYEFRNTRERQHCKVLNDLLNRMEKRNLYT